MPATLRALALATLVAAVALAGCRKEAPSTEAPPATGTDNAPLPSSSAGPIGSPDAALAVTTVDLGNAVGADKRVVKPMTTFATHDTIYASVATRTAQPSAAVTGRLGARWTYQDGQTVADLGDTYSFTGTGNTVFQISNPDGWPPGSYKVEVLLDDNVVQTRAFEVR